MARKKTRDRSRLLATVIALAGLFAVDRMALVLRDRTGSLCHGSPETLSIVETSLVSFHVGTPCFATGIELTGGDVYRFEVEDGEWHDGGLEADADGIRDVPFGLVVAGPTRRHISQPWIKLMGRVGQGRTETFAIGSGLAVHKARTTGELFLYVNDAVIGLGPGRHWAWPYYWPWGKNVGTARVAVSLIHGKGRIR